MRMDYTAQLEQSEKLVQKMWLKVSEQERQCQNLKNFVEETLHSSPSITPNLQSEQILDITRDSKCQNRELIKTPKQDLGIGHSAVEDPPCKAVRAQKGSQRITDNNNNSSNCCNEITALLHYCRSDSSQTTSISGTEPITGCLKYGILNPNMTESEDLFPEPDDTYLKIEDLLQSDTSEYDLRNTGDCFNYQQYSEGDHPQAQYQEKIIINTQIKPCLSRSVSNVDPYTPLRIIRTEIRESVGSIKTLIEESFENTAAKKQTTDDVRKLYLIYDEITKLVRDMRRDYASQHQKLKKRVQKLSFKVAIEERQCKHLKDLVDKILMASMAIPPNSKSAYARRLSTSKESTRNYIIDAYALSFESHKQEHAKRLLTSKYLEESARNYIDDYVSSFESRLSTDKWKPQPDRQLPCRHNEYSMSHPQDGDAQYLQTKKRCPDAHVQTLDSSADSKNKKREVIKKPNVHSEISHSESFVSSQKTYFDGINLPWLIWEVDLDNPPHSESSVSSQHIYLDGIKLPWLVWELDLDDPPSTTAQAQEDSQRFTDSHNNNYCTEISALSQHFSSYNGESSSMYETDLITSGLKYDTLNPILIGSINLFQEPDDLYMKSEDLLRERMCKTRVESGSIVLCTGKLCFF